MAAGKRRSGSKALFAALFRLFKAPRYSREVEEADHYKVWTSDEDRHNWVGEPDIDRKATAFIAKFHEARICDPQTFAI